MLALPPSVAWLLLHFGTLALTCALLGCGAADPQPSQEPFRFEHCDQAGGDGVSLTEWLRLRFSAPVDPGTLRRETIRISRLDSNGEPTGSSVAGRFRVLGRGDVVAFSAVVPLQADFQDGGFVPGSSYRVHVAGYPRPDGLRALDGRLLEESVYFEFRTVGRGQLRRLFTLPDEGWPGDEFPHVPSLQQGMADQPLVHFWADADTWLLVFDGPLRPDSLGPRSVRLVREPDPSAIARFQGSSADWPADELIPVALRLLRAEEARARLEQDEIPLLWSLPFDPRWLVDGCVLELRPQFVDPPKPDTSYFLAFEIPALIEGRGSDGYLIPPGLLGYGGQGMFPGQNQFVVTLRERPARTRTLSYDFLPGELLTGEDEELGLPIADGVLHTSEGVAEAFLATEGGTGEHGAFPTGIAVEIADVDSELAAHRGWQFERIIVPTGTTLQIRSEQSSLLRSQGRCTMQGSVVVPAPKIPAVATEIPEPSAGCENALKDLRARGVPYVAFLSSGELHWDGPLDAPGRVVILASSNRIRLSNSTTIRAAALWLFVPSEMAKLTLDGSGFGTVRERLPEHLALRDGEFHFDRHLSPRVPLHFRAVGASVPFGDLRRVFDPAVLARIALASGSEADVRTFVQVGEGPRAWEGVANYLRAGVPLTLPRTPRIRVGLEIRLMPRPSGEQTPPLTARVDRFEVLLR